MNDAAHVEQPRLSFWQSDAGRSAEDALVLWGQTIRMRMISGDPTVVASLPKSVTRTQSGSPGYLSGSQSTFITVDMAINKLPEERKNIALHVWANGCDIRSRVRPIFNDGSTGEWGYEPADPRTEPDLDQRAKLMADTIRSNANVSSYEYGGADFKYFYDTNVHAPVMKSYAVNYNYPLSILIDRERTRIGKHISKILTKV